MQVGTSRCVRRTAALAIVLALSMAGSAAAQTAPWLMLTGPQQGYVEVPHDADLNPTDALTIELWAHLVSHESWTGGGCPTLVGKRYTETYWLGVCSGHLRLYTHGSGSNRDSTGTVPLNEWVHIAAVFDGTDTHFYLNGVLDSTLDAVDGAMPSNTSALRIGSSTDYNVVPVGAFDEVRIWNVARSQQQIADSMNTTITTPMAGLVASWNFAGDASDPVGGHDGVLVGDAQLGGEIPAPNPCTEEAFVVAGAHAAGLGTSQWFTDMTFFSRFGVDSDVKLFLLPRNTDNSDPVSADFILPAGETLTLEDVVLQTFGESSLAAAFRICSAQPLQVDTRTYNQSASGTFGQGIPAVPATAGANNGSRQNLIGLYENADFRTNLGFANAESVEVTVEVELYDGSGILLDTLEVELPPYGHKQLSQVYTEVTDDDVSGGRISVRPSGGRVISYASVVDNLTGDGTFMLAR